MKNPLIIVLVLALLIIFELTLESNEKKLKTGDLSFIAYNSDVNDSFAIISHVDIKPKTTIYFTDSEWNGTRFGADENNLIWSTGETKIISGTIIAFNNLNYKPSVSVGNVYGDLKLSTKKEAVFCFIGNGIKSPSTFLCAFSNGEQNYGTLINTGLIKDETATIYPEDSYSAIFEGITKNKKKELLVRELNKSKNYSFNNNSHFELVLNELMNFNTDTITLN